MGVRPFLWTGLALIGLLACDQPPPGKGRGEIEQSPGSQVQFHVETVVGGLEVPWSLAFTPDGRIIVTERPGRVRVIENGNLRVEPLARIDDVEHTGESGLMSLVLHPRFADNRLLYLAYVYRDGGQRVRVVQFRDSGNTLSDRKVIIENIPAARFHAGTRLRFGPDGKLYITTGDATQRDLAQKLDSLAGKTLRLNDDGSVPPDNPFASQPGARPEVWSYGHRNAQGMDWQAATNIMFQTEHGPSGFDGPGGGDEVNIVEKGKNYGWPIVHHRDSRSGMESPLLEYTPAVAPASGVFYRGDLFSSFTGNFLFGALKAGCIIRVVLDGRNVVSQERLLEGKYGRIREVVEGPDGSIYFTTSNRDGRGTPASDDDRIIRLTPIKR